jgi:hypothetical protein
MSLSEPSTLDGTATEPRPVLQHALRTAATYVAAPVRFVAFWLAALLPLTYLPLLATGATAGHRTAFAGVLCLNAVAFVVGHSHNRPE